ncbi:MAG: phosphoribosylglycinamide formyltransferase [Candidatus Omnitrophica bacterium]|nr:phosphoribosylglycinamide formyltransferase [Candidatus Omnitrophota bacterium]
MTQKFAVFISGNGSNLQAIIDSHTKGEIKAQLALVISSNQKAFGLKRAEKAGIKTLVFDPHNYTNRQSVDRDIVIELKNHKIDFIVLAGYMRLLTPYFIKNYPNKILNVHPSLLPSFKGANGIKDAFTYGVKQTGVTIHFVNEKLDNGPIILQDSVKINEEDTLETLAEKIHRVEHRLYPQAVALLAENRLKIKGRRVTILDKPLESEVKEVKKEKTSTPANLVRK